VEPVVSRVFQIFTAPKAAAAMTARESVRAVLGQGLDGDRYSTGMGTFSKTPHRPDSEVTLIELENVEAFARAFGKPFTASMSRRNIVTAGVRLNALEGREFTVGAVRLRGVRLCEPCRILARNTFYEILPALNGKAGLRATILTAGLIRIGDGIVAEC
jgi:MOSC domain-containing protein YiiM